MTKKYKGLAIYYVLLLVVLVTWSSTSTAPPTIVRVVFLAAVLAPCFLKGIPIVFSFLIFFTITSYAPSYSYMPESLYLYAVFAFLCFLINMRQRSDVAYLSLPKSILVLLILSIFVNLFTSENVKNISWALLVLLFSAPLMKKNDKETLMFFSSSIIVVALTLSVLFLIIGSRYSQSYNSQSGLERMGWIDPNYFSSIIGMGTIVSLSWLFSKGINAAKKAFLLVVSGLSFYIMVTVASRGALLSLIVAFAVLLLFSKSKRIYKIIFIGLAAGFVVWMYNSSLFELLEYRIENDETGGSGRLDIWRTRISAFVEEGNIMNYLFGMGFDNTLMLGTSRKLGMHNDYLAFLIEYGLTGIVLLLSILLIPIIRLKEKENLPVVLTLIVYLATCIFTLEPLSLGIMVFYLFYLFIFYYSQCDSQSIGYT